MKLRYKITLIVTAFSLFVMFVMIVLYTNYLLEDRFEQTRERLLYESDNLAGHIQSDLLSALSVVKTMQSAGKVQKVLLESNAKYEKLSKGMVKKKLSKLNKIWMNTYSAKSPFILQYTDNKLAKYLREQKRVLPGAYGEIFVTNKFGALVAATEKLTTFEHDFKYWWKEGYDHGHGKVFFDDRGYDDSVGGYVIGIVSPIKKDGQIIGIIKANINVQPLLSKALRKYNKLSETQAKVVRSKGLIVYEKGFPPLSTRVSPKLTKRLEELKDGVTDMKIFDKEKIVAYAPVKLSLNDKNIVFGGKKRSIDHLLGNDGEIWSVVIEKDKDAIFNKVLPRINNLLLIGLFFIILLAIVLFIIVDRVSSPLSRLSEVVKKIGRGERDIKIEQESNDEVGELAKSFKDMFENLKKTTASRDELEKEVEKRVEAQKKLKERDEMLIAQSKQAAMGEMIGMIAHQWRQPISIISMAINNIMVDMELDELKEESVRECSSEILNETRYLSQTIDDFRNFFKPNKEKEVVLVQELYDDVYKLIGKSLENNNIELSFLGDTNLKVKTYGRELLQVFINILNNAKDALIESSRDEKKISILTCKEKKSIVFELCDNAGGVKKAIISKIFDPYFSTKDEKNGTGLGLYMSKTIVEKHLLGDIWVENRDNGACFVVKIPINLGKNDG